MTDVGARKRIGWQLCGEAGDGKATIEKAQQTHPNFIFLDLSLPVMDGLEAANILNRLMPARPLIMFASFIAHRLKQDALAAGSSRVMAKEGLLTHLVSVVRSFIN